MTDDTLELEPQQWTSLSRPELVEHALARGEGVLSRNGALVVESITPEDNYSADRYIVEEPSTEDVIDWRRNQSFQPDDFEQLWQRAESFLAEGDRYVQYVHAGDDLKHYLPVKIITQTAWQSLSALNLFTPTAEDSYNNKGKQEWQILNVPGLVCQPERDHTQGQRAVITHYARRKILIVGMHNGGEMKKAMFTVLSFLLPEREVLPLHCSASLNKQNQRVTLLVGASGSGKTALATGTDLTVIGDDEIGWGKTDVFNLEGGFYLRTSQLKQAEANEWLTPVRFGAVTENARLNEVRALDYEDEYTIHHGRCAYPFAYTRRAPMSMEDVSPDYLVILICDYSGVFPPIARLSYEAAVFHYLIGYDSSVVNREGVLTAVPAFRSCFTAPYLPRPAMEYADLLLKRLQQSEAKTYVLNTGALGDIQAGAIRTPQPFTQQLLASIQSGFFDQVVFRQDTETGFDVPAEPVIDGQNLSPQSYWSSPLDYQQAYQQLFQRFQTEADHWGIPETARIARLGG